jgi:hypothetical protein
LPVGLKCRAGCPGEVACRQDRQAIGAERGVGRAIGIEPGHEGIHGGIHGGTRGLKASHEDDLTIAGEKDRGQTVESVPAGKLERGRSTRAERGVDLTARRQLDQAERRAQRSGNEDRIVRLDREIVDFGKPGIASCHDICDDIPRPVEGWVKAPRISHQRPTLQAIHRWPELEQVPISSTTMTTNTNSFASGSSHRIHGIYSNRSKSRGKLKTC